LSLTIWFESAKPHEYWIYAVLLFAFFWAVTRCFAARGAQMVPELRKEI
jgi:hypothetical protein